MDFNAILKELRESFSTIESLSNTQIQELKKEFLKERNKNCYYSAINSFINKKDRERKITENVLKLQQGDQYSNLRNDTFNQLLMLKYDLDEENEYKIYSEARLFNSDTFMAFNQCVKTFNIEKNDNFIAYFYWFLGINKISTLDREDERILSHQETENKRTFSNKIIKDYMNLKRKENFSLSLDEFIDQNHSNLSKSKRLETITLYNAFYPGIVSLENSVQSENGEELILQIEDGALSAEEQAILMEKEERIVLMLNNLCSNARKEMQLTFRVFATIDLVKSGINISRYQQSSEFYLKDYFEFFIEQSSLNKNLKIDNNNLISSYLKDKKILTFRLVVLQIIKQNLLKGKNNFKNQLANKI